MKPAELISWAKQRGWVQERSAKGSHLVFRFPRTTPSTSSLSGSVIQDAVF